MSTISKEILSGSTNGRMVKVVATATPGTLIHTAIAGVTDIDEIWMYAVNTDTTARLLTIEWGAATDTIPVTIQPQTGLVLVVPGLPLQNSLTVNAFAAVANVIFLGVFANRITA